MPTPRRRVSLNEVLRLARRVFQAMGVGPGCEVEAAQAVAWLEMHGLGGLACLHADLPALGGAMHEEGRGLRLEDGVQVLDGHGGSALFPLQDALALAMASPPPARVAITSVRTPAWLAPCIAAAGADAGLWGIAEGDGVVLRVTGDAHGPVLHAVPEFDALAGRVCAIRLGNGPPPAPPAGAWSIDGAALRRRREGALRRGVAADARVWDTLSSFARGALVPESEHSRLHGAGGGDDNL